MNERIHIEHARVIKKGAYAYGNNDKGAWASIHLKVEWDFEYKDQTGASFMGKQSAVVRLTGDNALWARDNVTEGNRFAPTPVPDTFLNLWCRCFGEFNERPRKDGTGTWEDISNGLVADFVELVTNQQ